MNEIERAIAGLLCIYDDDTYPQCDKDIQLAIDALQEKLARELGCYGCLTPIPGFRFCSHCGRRLEVQDG